MAADPWSRPTLQDLQAVLESIEKVDPAVQRAAERLELSVPAEIVTARGSVVPAMTREISRYGIGLLHRGAVGIGEAIVRMASDTREYRYRITIEWCRPADNGMFMSGGRFVGKLEPDE